jgi:hypothetical protein
MARIDPDGCLKPTKEEKKKIQGFIERVSTYLKKVGVKWG